MFLTVYTIGAVVALCALITVAVWKAGPYEQAASGFYAAGWTLSTAAQYLIPSYVPWVLGVDTLTTVALAAIAWRSSKEWTVFAVAAQAVGVAVSLFYWLDDTIPQNLYVIALSIISLSVLVIIGWGVTVAARAPQRSTLAP